VLVAFAGGRDLDDRYRHIIDIAISEVSRRGWSVVVGDSVGADYFIASSCSSFGVPCLVVAVPHSLPSLSFVASSRVPSSVSLSYALCSGSLRRRLACRTSVVASFSSFGVVFGGGRGSLGIFARSILRRGGRVVWFPCGVPVSELDRYGLHVSGSYKFGRLWGLEITLLD